MKTREREEKMKSAWQELRGISQFLDEELADCRYCMYVDLSGPMAVGFTGHLQQRLAADEAGKSSCIKGCVCQIRTPCTLYPSTRISTTSKRKRSD